MSGFVHARPGRLAPPDWHEGQLVGPEVLVHADEANRRQREAERHLVRSDAWGLDEIGFSTDDLDGGVVRINRLRAIMPDGRLIDVPGNAASVAVRVDRDRLGPGPWRVDVRMEQGEDGDAPVEHDGVAVRIGRLGLRLQMAGEPSGHELPVARLTPNPDAGPVAIRVDEGFVPPLVTMRGAPALMDRVRALTVLLDREVETARVHRINAGERALADAGGIRRMLRSLEMVALRGDLHDLGGRAGACPRRLWSVLRHAADRLDHLDGRPCDAVSWTQAEPGRPFGDVLERLRGHLGAEVDPGFSFVSFRREADHWMADAARADFRRANRVWLCVSDAARPEDVIDIVSDPDRFKLIPRRHRARMNAEGMRLSYTPLVPDAVAARGRSSVHFSVATDDVLGMWAALVDGEPCEIECTQPPAARGGGAVDFSLAVEATPPDAAGPLNGATS